MTLIGYVRVSTASQDWALQEDALSRAGCSKIFSDQISGSLPERPGLNQALVYLREGDCLVVWKLDRLGRSLPHLISTVNALGDRGCLSCGSSTARGREDCVRRCERRCAAMNMSSHLKKAEAPKAEKA